MARIVVVSPAPIKGSGGIRTILAYARALIDAGHEASVAFLDDGKPLGANLTQQITHLYGISGLPAARFPAGLESAELVVATRWDTPRAIRNHYPGPLVHLIQDIEGWFNPVGDAYLNAENNFLFDTHFITLGNWLAKKLQTEVGAPAFTMDFGYEPDIYRFERPYEQRERRICFIYQPEKPRRCTQIGIEALGIVHHQRPDVEIVLYGNDLTPSLWYPVVSLGIVPPRTLNQLYNSSVVGLCISASNPSRIPFEMTGCGLPVVDIFRGNNLHDYTENDGILLAHQTPESIAQAILSILDNPQYGHRLSRAARAFSEGRSMKEEISSFVSFVNQILDGKAAKYRKDMAPTYRGAPVIANAYTLARVRAFCESQTKQFINDTSAPLSVSESAHVSNTVTIGNLLNSKITSAVPENFPGTVLNFPNDNVLETHAVEGMVVSAVIPHALPAGITRVNAIVRIANENSTVQEFAMALAPSHGDDDTILVPTEDFWESENATGWHTVQPQSDCELRLDLPLPTSTPMDIHVAVRVPEGKSQNFAWCRWLQFNYLTAVASEI